MSDEVDRAQDLERMSNEDALRAARKKAQSIPTGEPGECEWCGEYFTRLVNGACGGCRDKWKLK